MAVKIPMASVPRSPAACHPVDIGKRRAEHGCHIQPQGGPVKRLHKSVQRLQKGHKLVAQDPAESRPVDGCKQAVQPRTNARSKSHPVKALEKCIDEVQDGIQSITYCAAQQPPVQVLHSTVQPIVQVGGPPDRGGVDRPQSMAAMPSLSFCATSSPT